MYRSCSFLLLALDEHSSSTPYPCLFLIRDVNIRAIFAQKVIAVSNEDCNQSSSECLALVHYSPSLIELHDFRHVFSECLFQAASHWTIEDRTTELRRPT